MNVRFFFMHGHLISDQKDLSEGEKLAERAAAESAADLLAEVIRLKEAKLYSEEALVKSIQLIRLNPELALAWNFRREAILGSGQGLDLTEELKLVNNVMVDLLMTKSYCLWNHRRWILSQIADVETNIIQGEKDLVGTILDLDARNFHAWSYRKWLSLNFPAAVQWDDLSFSRHLIEKDFSNYSAWHLRRSCCDLINKEDELELVWNALFTEPSDQSCWQYHDWLIEKFPQLVPKDDVYLQELESVIAEKDSKYILLRKLSRMENQAAEKEQIAHTLIRIDPLRKGLYLDLIESA